MARLSGAREQYRDIGEPPYNSEVDILSEHRCVRNTVRLHMYIPLVIDLLMKDNLEREWGMIGLRDHCCEKS